MYNDVILNHFMNPRHLGQMEKPDGAGTTGDAGCGDFMRIFIRVEPLQDRIVPTTRV